ncbi:hypothetical protein LWX53_07620 [bacterium]|nr:hypothetical protein [bacterium]
MKFSRTLHLCIFMIVGAMAAGAQTKLTFSAISSPAAILYSALSSSAGTGSVTVLNKTTSSASYYFTCKTDITSRTAAYGSNSIAYHVYKSGVTPYATILPWSSSLTYNDVLYGTVARNASATQYYDVVVDAGLWVPAGTYTGTLEFELDKGSPGQNNLQASKATSITIQVEPTIGLALLTAGTSYTSGALSANLDFGTLAAGNTQTVNAVVRSNAPWSLSVTATSGGYLKYTAGSGEVFQIPYSLYFNGGSSPTSLSTGSATLLSNQSWTSSGDQSYQLKFVIGNFDIVDPGTYSDAITVQLTAN